jgi:ethanolamine utilization protein EutN/carbon dioxide concentrating mechanism protein CcmL
MVFAKVVGTVVSSVKEDNIDGASYLLVELCGQNGAPKGDYIVALDLVGAEYSEMVLISQGSSCRQTEYTNKKPVDCVIPAIVDIVDEEGKVVFSKQH